MNPLQREESKEPSPDVELNVISFHQETEKSSGGLTDLIFDSLEVSFSFHNFFTQLFLHVTAPIFVIFASRNQNFLDLSPTSIVFSTVVPSMVFVMIVTYILSNGDHEGITRGALWIPLSVYILHKINVSVKYASLSKTEYNRFMEEKNIELAKQYQSQMQIVSGWLYRAPGVLEYALVTAALQCGVDINELTFSIANPEKCPVARAEYRSWKVFLSESGEEMTLQPDGSYTISCFAVCLALIRTADDKNKAILEKTDHLGFVVTLISCAIPFLFANGDISGIATCPSAIVFYIASTIVNIACFPIIVKFMVVAIYDVTRQRAIMEELVGMIGISGQISSAVMPGQSRASTLSIRESEVMLSIAEDERKEKRASTMTPETARMKRRVSLMQDAFLSTPSDQLMPRLSLRNTNQNIETWCVVRNMMTFFGERFRKRIEANIAFNSVAAIGLIVAALAQFVMSNDRVAYFESTFFIQSLEGVTVMAVFFVIFSYQGATVNDEMDSHRGIFSSHRLRLRTLRSGLIMAMQETIRDKNRASQSIRRKTRDSIDSTDEERMIRRKDYEMEDLKSRLEDLEEMDNSLEIALESVELTNDLRSYQILGINAQYAVTTTVISATLSFYVAVISMFLTAINEENTVNLIQNFLRR